METQETKAAYFNSGKLGISAQLSRKTTAEIQHLINTYQEQINLYLDMSFKPEGYGDLSPRSLGSRTVYPQSILKSKIADLKNSIQKLEKLKASIKSAQEG